jgi:iron complex outermembrane recepter protein
MSAGSGIAMPVFRRTAVLSVITGVLSVSSPVESIAQEAASDRVDTVVVTGSYIRRDAGFDSMTPIGVIDAANIAEQGHVNVGDILRNETFSYGTDTLSSTNATGFQQGARSFANIRGLGTEATLTLLNGRRVLNSNVNLIYPQIAIERIETVKDGGSALYGADAVAGVLNLIPKTRFEGIEVNYFHRAMASGPDWTESNWNAILGASLDRTHVVAAFQWRETDMLKRRDLPKFAERSTNVSTQGNPGTWLVPTRNASGALTGASQRTPDPGCGIDETTGQPNWVPGNNRSGFIVGTSCAWDFTEWPDFVPKIQQFVGWAHIEHEFTQSLRFRGDFSFAESDAFAGGNSGSFTPRTAEAPPVRGEHPGNPFRAMANRGNGLEPIFARDSNGDGIPDRDANGLVVLAADPFDASAGVPFNEDVRIASLRIFGKQGTRNYLQDENRQTSGSASSIDTNFRWTGGFQLDLPYRNWQSDLTFSHQRLSLTIPGVSAENFSAFLLGLEGRGGLNQSLWFNPFSTDTHPCVNRICDPSVTTQPGDPGYNTQEIVDSIAVAESTVTRNKLSIADVVFTGDLWDLPAGPLGLAVGGQWRSFDYNRDNGPLANSCNRAGNPCATDLVASRTTRALFAEALIPAFDSPRLGSLDLSAAIRHEDEGSFSSTDPKVALRWQVRPQFALRASASTSFIAPSVVDLFDKPLTSSQQLSDETCRISGACPVVTTSVARTFSGNPDLRPETADIWSAGFTLSLLDDDLRFSFDYLSFAFDNRISTLNGQDVIDADARRFAEFFAGGGTRAAWIDPVNKATGNFESQDIRRLGGEIVEVLTYKVNAQQMDWRGFDVSMLYRWEAAQMPWIGGDYGRFTFALDGTYLQDYLYTLTVDPNETCAGTTRRPPCQGAGNRNDRTAVVPPLPRVRANGRLSWFYGNHSAALIGRYMHHVREDSTQRARNPEYLPNQTLFDLQYTFSLEGLLGARSATSVTLGCLNCLDELPPPIFAPGGGIETFLYDPRGRTWYLRLQQSL